MKSRKCANYERHGWMEDAEDPRSFCTHCEIERLRADLEDRVKVVAEHRKVIIEQSARLHAALAVKMPQPTHESDDDRQTYEIGWDDCMASVADALKGEKP